MILKIKSGKKYTNYMNILVTGGAGFIGSRLSLELVKRGHKVTVLDNLSPQIHGKKPEKHSQLYQSIKDKVEFILGDVRHLNDWKLALVNQDVVVHLAAETGTGQSMYRISQYTDVNIGGTSLMLDLLTNSDELRVKKIIIASSRSIYGEGKYLCEKHMDVYPNERLEKDMLAGDFGVKCPVCGSKVKIMATDEKSMIHPSSYYGITKQVQEQMCMTIGKSIGIPVVAFRYQNVYGPGQSLSNPYTGILSIFSTSIMNGNDINVFEDGRESRDFVFIDDVVRATILGIEREEADYQVFNVGSGIPTSVADVAKHLKSNYNSKVAINISGNFRLGDIRANYADISHISRVLNFQPTVFFDIGIKRFSDWVKTQKIHSDGFSKSIDEMRSKGLFK